MLICRMCHQIKAANDLVYVCGADLQNEETTAPLGLSHQNVHALFISGLQAPLRLKLRPTHGKDPKYVCLGIDLI